MSKTPTGPGKGPITLRELPQAVIVAVADQVLKGSYDDDFRTVLDRAVKLGKDVGLDFSQTRYINSTSISGLVQASKKLADAGRRLVVIAPTPEVANILYVTGIERLIETASSVDDFLTPKNL